MLEQSRRQRTPLQPERKKASHEDGFVLISLSILIILISLAISAYLYGLQAQRNLERTERTNQAFTSVMNKIATYLATEGRLPCPAARNLAPSSTQYGIETNCGTATVGVGSCGSGYCVTSRSGQRIRIGIVPFATLKIDPQDAADAYGNFFTYALTERQGVTATYLGENGGTIELQDSTVTPPTSKNVDFVIVSHGEDGAGSFKPTGQKPHQQTCSTTYADKENCDNDAVFAKRPYALAKGPSYFDDQVETNLLNWVYIWDATYGSAKGSYSRGGLGSNMGVGTEDPQRKLHIGNNGNLRIENGFLATKQICDKSGNNCFSPSVLGGNVNASTQNKQRGMQCGSGSLMIGIRNGGAVCGTIGPASSKCPADSFFSGISYTSGGVLQVTCRNALNGSTTTVPLN